MKKAFTLIELLIVVAIIAILAAIAVPNFLEAQTRSKVARVKSDLRTYATAIESYAVDHNKPPREANDTFYPPPGAYDTDYNAATNAQSPLAGNIANVLSTPVSYITVARIKDVFQDKNLNTALDEQYYTYQDLQYRSERAGASPFWLVVPTFYGPWRMVSVGPDQRFGHAGTIPTAQLAYDATNGTISAGNIFRSPNVNDSRQPDPGRAYTNGTISAILLGAP